MEILLIRHGQAVDEAPGLGDAGRWLNAKGRKVTRKVSRWLGKKDKRRPLTIWTSPLVRSLQTAEILAAEVGFEGEVKPISELSPGRDPGDLIKLLAAGGIEGPIALIGHEPSLSLIAGALLGDIGLGSIKKSAVVGLTWEEGAGKFRFLFDPNEMKAIKRLETRPASAEDGAPPATSAQA